MCYLSSDNQVKGTYDAMLPDAEIIRIVTEVFDALGWNGTYTVKL